MPTETATEDKKTTVGNYFVSNYPPFAYWQKEQAAKAEAILKRPAPSDTPLGVYFHVPFCRKRCHFCYFRVYTDKKASEINDYLDAGLAELERYASRPYIQGRKADFVYFGGGTPSYLSEKQLARLTSAMKAAIPWDEAREVAFEAEPGTLREKKLDAIRDMGVTRLSMGIENFDDHILGLNGRAHRSREIFRAYEYAKKIGFPQINIDLIAGMIDETDENWAKTVQQAIDLDPECVTIYQMEIPYNTTIYKQMKESGQITAPVADWDTKRKWVKYAFEQFEAAGYTVTSGYTVVKNPKKVQFVYRDALWGGADLLALGVASFGHLAGLHYQNQANVDPYMELIERGDELPIFRAYETNREEQLIREFILQLKLGKVERAYFERKFGVSVAEKFGHVTDRFVAEGYFEQDEKEIRVNRDGLLEVDRLLHDYFLPQHIGDRYV
ncbi:MAG: coproporphyrinogen-III oxidase family protein [Verrucomicrobiota bacterium]